MKKFIVLAALAAAMVVPVVATSATLANGHQQNCKGTGELWHFVNNQIEGAAGGYLTVTFNINGVPTTQTVWAAQKNSATIHWNVYTTGDATLVSAKSGSTQGGSDIPGKLVLSDFCKKG